MPNEISPLRATTGPVFNPDGSIQSPTGGEDRSHIPLGSVVDASGRVVNEAQVAVTPSGKAPDGSILIETGVDPSDLSHLKGTIGPDGRLITEVRAPEVPGVSVKSTERPVQPVTTPPVVNP